MNGVLFLAIGIALGMGAHAAVTAFRRRREASEAGAVHIPADAFDVTDLLRRAHDASAACLVMPGGDALWSKDDPPPPDTVVERMLVGATWSMGDGQDHVLHENGVIVAAGDGRSGGAVAFTSDVSPAVVDAVTGDIRSLLADYEVDRTRVSAPLDAPHNMPQWLLPESVEAVGFGLCDAAHRLTGRPTAVVMRDPITQIASIVAVSVGADRRLLRSTVAPESAAGRACMGTQTVAGEGAAGLLGGTRHNRRMREERGVAFALRNGRPGVGALVVFGLPETAPPEMLQRLSSMVREAGPIARRSAAVRASEQRAVVDEVTGHPNRRSLVHAMREHDNEPCSLLCVGIDQYDQLNENARDPAARHVASVFRHTLRDYDVLARLPGEEFGLFLPDTPFYHAFAVADRVRVAVGESIFDFGGTRRLLTCSMGVASVPETVPQVDHLLPAADEALDLAKSKGRNRVWATPPSDTPQARAG